MMNRFGKFFYVILMSVLAGINIVPAFSQSLEEKGLSIPENERKTFELNEESMKKQLITDAIVFTGSAFFYGTAEYFKGTMDFPEYTERTYDIGTQNSLDRWAAHPYNRTFDTCGDISMTMSGFVFPASVFITEGAIGNMSLKEELSLALMYAETVCLGNAIKEVIKMSVQRPRPYMYFDNPDAESLDNHDFEFSFLSGHTLNAFMGAGFLSYNFCKYYSGSSFKVPVVLTSYGLACATGTFRILSGNHFPTDVMAGAALGTVLGIGVPMVHSWIFNNSDFHAGPVESITVLPTGFVVRMTF